MRKTQASTTTAKTTCSGVRQRAKNDPFAGSELFVSAAAFELTSA